MNISSLLGNFPAVHHNAIHPNAKHSSPLTREKANSMRRQIIKQRRPRTFHDFSAMNHICSNLEAFRWTCSRTRHHHVSKSRTSNIKPRTSRPIKIISANYANELSTTRKPFEHLCQLGNSQVISLATECRASKTLRSRLRLRTPQEHFRLAGKNGRREGLGETKRANWA